MAMGVEHSAASGALRLTLGRTSTQTDVDAVLAALPAAYERARRAGLSSRAVR
jgi:cysteine desulfurase